MPEIWDYLGRAKRQKALCASDVEAIKESCRQNHNHRHVIECVECYGKVLERMHDRYIASPDAECFLVQATFPKEMGDLFAQARERRSALREIEERAAKGRQARIVQIVKGSQVIRHLLKDSGQVHLLPKMDSGNIALSTVLGEIRNSLGHVPAPSEDVDHCLVQLTGAEALPAEETLQVIHKIFFSDYKDSSAKGCQEELERLRNGSSLDVVMEHRLERSLASKDLKEKHRRRLDELRRAQSAHEVAKSRKTKDRKTVAPPQTPAPSLEVPPCTACHGAVDSKSFFSCPLCQIRAGLDDRWHPAVFCSSACYHEIFDSHLNDTHFCTAADDCAQLRVEDGAMDCDGSPVLCTHCLEQLKTLTPYCSKQCAEMDMQHHRQSVHQRQGEKINSGLDHSNGQVGSEGHVTDLHVALAALEKETSVTIKPLE
ncbi:hypothetical protein MAPG_11006 [Magnaporthiopsis poae ATCC 64411]|uniref:Suppressor of anucleate metulae protein B n=1 Tax=Magnaporthiopsis poae (strain ATCC 64411 / 73-15) TaxID=644358 RepID=A0A0C4EE41_MAGP6|nr:hypothetical protein MAPG_11006 [Magnaporthiopsis poae ATCC 64411]